MADYFKAQQPALDNVRTALAIFAVFIIARFLVRRITALVRPLRRTADTQAEAASGLEEDCLQLMSGEKSRIGRSFADAMPEHKAGHKDGSVPALRAKLTIDPNWTAGSQDLPRQIISRFPPAPPLTPPELSSTVFSIAPGQRQDVDSFMHQPNPDYMSSTAGISQEGSTAPSTPRRRSYNRTLPIGIPTPQPSFKASGMDPSSTAFSPSSYPPTSPLLPPPPPSSSELQVDSLGHRDVDVKGQIISVLNDDGAGWTRHTRVYGGGVCLACAASGGEGGFYGAAVTPEEMRHDAYARRAGGVSVHS